MPHSFFKCGLLNLLNTKQRQRTLTERPNGRVVLKPIPPKPFPEIEQEQQRRHSVPPRLLPLLSQPPNVRDFIVIKNLSRSQFTTVDLAQCRFTSKLLVLKSYNLLSNNSLHSKSLYLDKMNKCEVSIMSKVNHPNVVRLIDTFEDKENNRRYLVLEYLQGGALVSDSFITCKPLVISSVWRYFCDLVNALDYLHEMNIVHRDIKPSNLLLTSDDHIKLSDFGVSIDMASNYQSAAALTGSSAFLAPELVSGYIARASTSSDIWATGITLFYLVFGRLPFYDQQVFRLYRKICQVEVSFPPFIDPLLQHVLLSMMDKNPKTRITAYELMSHPFVLHGPYKSSVTILDQEVVNQRIGLLSSHDSAHTCSTTCIHRLLPTVFRSDQNVFDMDETSSSDPELSLKRSFSDHDLPLDSLLTPSWVDDDTTIITDDDVDFAEFGFEFQRKLLVVRVIKN
ncbi:hypothetical protein GEMRC1_000210 [Eukaryota sp. GEM-RC1]